MSCLAEGVKVVGKMLFEGADGVTAVTWIAFNEEDADSAGAYRVLQGGRLERLDDVGPWREWKKVAHLAAKGGG